MKASNKILKFFLSLFAVALMVFTIQAAIPAVDSWIIGAVTVIGYAATAFIPGGGLAFIGPNFGALMTNVPNPRGFRQTIVNYLSEMGAKVGNLPKTLGDYVAWHVLNVAGSTTVEFFTGTYTASQTNQREGFTRAENEHMVITGLQLAMVDTASAFGAAALSNGITNAQLLSSKIDIIVNGVSQLKGQPGSDFEQVAEISDSGLVTFLTPIVWPGQTNLVVRITAPSAITGAAANVFLQVKLRGFAMFS